MGKVSRYGSVFILTHGLVALVHELAHRFLHVGLPPLRYAIAYLFVGILPLVALALLWTSRPRAAFRVLFVSMAGALLFAGFHHFILNNPDHVYEIPPGAWRPVFRATACLLALLEGYGCWLSLRLLRQVEE